MVAFTALAWLFAEVLQRRCRGSYYGIIAGRTHTHIRKIQNISFDLNLNNGMVLQLPHGAIEQDLSTRKPFALTVLTVAPRIAIQIRITTK
jgi:hypothetical protein